ncbi:hypothetical protein [Moorena producens]|uniref:hypothetical protein n=1 Tax=Moorena producens TaxID=1155739 RepID=UPI003C779195
MRIHSLIQQRHQRTAISATRTLREQLIRRSLCHQFPIPDSRFPIPDSPLPITNYLLPITHYPLPITLF